MSLTEPPFDLEQTEQRITVVCRLPLQLSQGHRYASLWEQLSARAFEQLTVDFSHIVAYKEYNGFSFIALKLFHHSIIVIIKKQREARNKYDYKCVVEVTFRRV